MNKFPGENKRLTDVRKAMVLDNFIKLMKRRNNIEGDFVLKIIEDLNDIVIETFEEIKRGN